MSPLRKKTNQKDVLTLSTTGLSESSLQGCIDLKRGDVALGLAHSSRGVLKVLPVGRKGVTPVSAVNVVQVEPALWVVNTRFLHSICKSIARLKVFTYKTFLIMSSTALILIFIFNSYVNTRVICIIWAEAQLL